jgi:DNA-binding transcriptional LysR family regulator
VMDISRPSPWHRKISDAFARSKAPLNVTLENAPIETIKKMVAIGIGIGFVPRISVREEIATGELCIVPVEGFHQERSVWLVRRKTVHSLAAKAFAQMAVSFGERMLCEIPIPISRPVESPSSELAKGDRKDGAKRGAGSRT